MTQTNHYKVEVKVQNYVGVLARITILLRKFEVNISTLEVHPIPNSPNFSVIHMLMDSSKDPSAFSIVMNKLERLIPVISVDWHRNSL